MKQVVLKSEDLFEHKVGANTPIFARKGGKLAGMIVREDGGWILRIGGCLGAHGFHSARDEAMKAAMADGYTFFIED